MGETALNHGDPIHQFLHQHGAAAIEHPGGRLLDHLERVGELVADLGGTASLVAAARTHAAYGTDGFEHRLLDPQTERTILRELIGSQAESLVYRYASCDRHETWRQLVGAGRFVDRFTGDVEYLGGGPLRDLIDLSIVNELDVLAHARLAATTLRELAALFQDWSPRASPAIARCAQAHLASPNGVLSARGT